MAPGYGALFRCPSRQTSMSGMFAGVHSILLEDSIVQSDVIVGHCLPTSRNLVIWQASDILSSCPHPAVYCLWVYDILSAKVHPNGDVWSFAILAVASTGVVQASWWKKSPALLSWLIAVTCVFIVCLPHGTYINVYLMVVKMSVTPRGDRVPISTRHGCHLTSRGFHFLCMP